MMGNTAKRVKRVSLLLAERFQTEVLAKTAAPGLLRCVANGVLVNTEDLGWKFSKLTTNEAKPKSHDMNNRQGLFRSYLP